MRRMIMMAKWYSGNRVGLKLPDIRLTGEEKPQKNPQPGNLSRPDRTRVRCMTDAHATACSSAVDKLKYHHSVLPKDRSFTANSSTKAAVLSKGRSSTVNSGIEVAVLLGINRCGSFPLLSAPHSLFSIWTNLKRSQKIPGAASWKWGERIWRSGSSRLPRNSPKG